MRSHRLVPTVAPAARIVELVIEYRLEMLHMLCKRQIVERYIPNLQITKFLLLFTKSAARLLSSSPKSARKNAAGNFLCSLLCAQVGQVHRAFAV